MIYQIDETIQKNIDDILESEMIEPKPNPIAEFINDEAFKIAQKRYKRLMRLSSKFLEESGLNQYKVSLIILMTFDPSEAFDRIIEERYQDVNLDLKKDYKTLPVEQFIPEERLMMFKKIYLVVKNTTEEDDVFNTDSFTDENELILRKFYPYAQLFLDPGISMSKKKKLAKKPVLLRYAILEMGKCFDRQSDEFLVPEFESQNDDFLPTSDSNIFPLIYTYFVPDNHIEKYLEEDEKKCMESLRKDILHKTGKHIIARYLDISPSDQFVEIPFYIYLRIYISKVLNIDIDSILEESRFTKSEITSICSIASLYPFNQDEFESYRFMMIDQMVILMALQKHYQKNAKGGAKQTEKTGKREAQLQYDIEELKEENQKKDQKIKELKEQLIRLEEKQRNTSRKDKTMADENANLRKKIKNNRKIIDELKKENELLKERNKETENKNIVRSEAAHPGETVLVSGDFEPLWEGEQKELILTVLEESVPKPTTEDKSKWSRRELAVYDAIDSNDFQRIPKKSREKLKEVLRGCMRVSSSDESKLKQLGLTLETGKTHNKLVFMDNRSYVFPMSKTSSDCQSSMNMALTISRRLY